MLFRRRPGRQRRPHASMVKDKHIAELFDLFSCFLPVLFATFSESLEIAYSIAFDFKSIDFLEPSFPCEPYAFKSLCDTFGHPCDDARLTAFANAQIEWFARKVPPGEHLDYKDVERCPYDSPTAVSDTILRQRYHVKAFRSKTGNY